MGLSASLRLRTAVCAAAYLVLIGVASRAMADGQPLVLDTQTGIHDGQSGFVLQNAPLSRAAIVPAQQLPTPDQSNDATSGQPPIIVAPYVAVPGAKGTAQAPAASSRMPPANRQ
ncbi:hypothetical protein [Trinickia acidisoli]|uniref:hypothetical protein n=1 Tax=Trinickia acidisoli TaxID=2767482 RepID=UPI0035ABC24A